MRWYRAVLGLRGCPSDLTDRRMQDVQAEFSEEERWLVFLASKRPKIKPVGMSLPVESVVILGPAHDSPLSFQD